MEIFLFENLDENVFQENFFLSGIHGFIFQSGEMATMEIILYSLTLAKRC